MVHRNARLTPNGRRILVERVLAGPGFALRHECPDGLPDPGPRRYAQAVGPGPGPGPGPGNRGADPGIPGDRPPLRTRRSRRHGPRRRQEAWQDPGRGGWRADPKQSVRNDASGHTRVGFDYVHVAVDDHTRLAYAEVLPDEKSPTCAGFLTRAAAAMAASGAPVKRVMTDNAFAYRLSRDFQDALAQLGVKRILIKPRHPWQNGKAERFNRTLQEGWAFTSNQARTDALKSR